MKAAFFKEHGGSEKIVYDEYRDPVADAGELVVRVKACALNQVDMLLLDGRFPPPEGLPHVNGCEVAGTVESMGAGVKGFMVGQRMLGGVSKMMADQFFTRMGQLLTQTSA